MYDLSIGHGVGDDTAQGLKNALCTGAVKATQNFVRVLCTEVGTDALEPMCGTNFLSVFSPRANVREDLLEAYFQLAMTQAVQYMSANYDVADDEAVSLAAIESWQSDRSGITLNISVTTRAGGQATASMVVGYPLT